MFGTCEGEIDSLVSIVRFSEQFGQMIETSNKTTFQSPAKQFLYLESGAATTQDLFLWKLGREFQYKSPHKLNFQFVFSNLIATQAGSAPSKIFPANIVPPVQNIDMLQNVPH